MTLLSVDNLALQRGHNLLTFPDFRLEPGERLLLLGPSGSGKTSLMSMIAGLLTPSRGSVFWRGQDFFALGMPERDRIRSRELGFVFQTLHLLPSLTLKQNILLAPRLAGIKDQENRAEKLLARLGLPDKAQRKPSELSQGEQQRGAIARALMNNPSVLMADEPTSALDDVNAYAVADLMIEQAQATGAALMVATHDSRLVSRFDKILHLK